MVALLIRHAHTDGIGMRLNGRQRGVRLSEQGRREAADLVDALRYVPLTAIYSSPRERALETAEPVACDHGLQVLMRPRVDEIDFGEWTGRTIESLGKDPAWHRFNRERDRARAPGGEALAEVQQRVVEELLALSRVHPGELIAIVTHAEPIRCAVAAFERASLDDVASVEISPGCITAVGIEPHVQRVVALNVRPDVAAALTVTA
jgi:probable phosphoglycerate mutase